MLDWLVHVSVGHEEGRSWSAGYVFTLAGWLGCLLVVDRWSGWYVDMFTRKKNHKLYTIINTELSIQEHWFAMFIIGVKPPLN